MMKQLLQNLWVKGKNAFLSLSHANTRELLLYCLLLLFLPTQLGKHFWPEYSLVSGFRVDYLSPTLYVTDILIILLFSHWVLSRKKYTFTTSIRSLLPYLLILLFLALTILPSAVPGAGLYTLVKVAEFLFVGWYTARHIFIPSYTAIVPRIFIFTVLFESILTFLQVANKGSLGGVLYFLGERSMSSLTPGAATTILQNEVILRPYATFSHPNVLAGFLVLSLLYLLFKKREFACRYGEGVLAISLVLGTIALFLTLSRIAIALYIVSLIGIGVMKLYQQNIRRLTLLGIIGVITVVSIMSFTVLGNVRNRFLESSLTEEAVAVRGDLMEIAIHVISSSPLLGVGLGNYLPASVQFRDTTLPLFFTVQPVHNIFLLVWAEIGILGFMLFIWGIIMAFYKASRPAKILLSVALILGLFDHYFLTLQQGQLLLSFLLGFCFAGKDKESPQH